MAKTLKLTDEGKSRLKHIILIDIDDEMVKNFSRPVGL